MTNFYGRTFSAPFSAPQSGASQICKIDLEIKDFVLIKKNEKILERPSKCSLNFNWAGFYTKQKLKITFSK